MPAPLLETCLGIALATGIAGLAVSEGTSNRHELHTKVTRYISGKSDQAITAWDIKKRSDCCGCDPSQGAIQKDGMYPLDHALEIDHNSDTNKRHWKVILAFLEPDHEMKIPFSSESAMKKLTQFTPAQVKQFLTLVKLRNGSISELSEHAHSVDIFFGNSSAEKITAALEAGLTFNSKKLLKNFVPLNSVVTKWENAMEYKNTCGHYSSLGSPEAFLKLGIRLIEQGAKKEDVYRYNNPSYPYFLEAIEVYQTEPKKRSISVQTDVLPTQDAYIQAQPERQELAVQATTTQVDGFAQTHKEKSE